MIVPAAPPSAPDVVRGHATRRSARPRVGRAADASPHRPTPAPAPAAGWEQRGGRALAFLRRRITGDYEVDEFGFDPDLTDSRRRCRVPAAVRAGGSGPRSTDREHPGRGRRAAGGQSRRRDLGAGRRDDRGRGATTSTRGTATCACSAPTWCSPRPVLGPLARKTGSTLACQPDAERLLRAVSWSACGRKGSRGSASRSASATSCSGSAGAGSCTAALRTGRADHPGVDRRRRGDPPDAGQRQGRWPGCWTCPTSRSRRRSRGSARSGWCRCRASGTSSSATPIDTAASGRRRGRRPGMVFELTDRVRETIQARCTGCSFSAARSGADSAPPEGDAPPNPGRRAGCSAGPVRPVPAEPAFLTGQHAGGDPGRHGPAGRRSRDAVLRRGVATQTPPSNPGITVAKPTRLAVSERNSPSRSKNT